MSISFTSSRFSILLLRLIFVRHLWLSMMVDTHNASTFHWGTAGALHGLIFVHRHRMSSQGPRVDIADSREQLVHEHEDFQSFANASALALIVVPWPGAQGRAPDSAEGHVPNRARRRHDLIQRHSLKCLEGIESNFRLRESKTRISHSVARGTKKSYIYIYRDR